MRLTLRDKEIIGLTSVLKDSTIDFKKHKLDNISLLNKIENEKNKPVAATKQAAAKTARDIRIKQTKEKIANTINLLRMENKKINLSTISTESKVSYSTVHKYKDYIEQLFPVKKK